MDFRIFVAPYNNPTANKWLDPTDADYDAAVAEISQDGQIEIFAPDHEGFDGIRTESVFELEAIAAAASASSDAGAFIVYMGHTGLDAEQAACSFEDAFSGEHDSEEAFAEQLADDTIEIPSHLAPYFNYAKFARDLFICDYFSVESLRGVYIFRHV
jgi:hypothetical protein